jgi:hypothetical protein
VAGKGSSASELAARGEATRFGLGYDPRRNLGNVPRPIWEAREALAKHLPIGDKALGELLVSREEKIKLGAVALLYEFTLPKPKEGETVAEKLKEIFGQLREKLDASTYRLVLETIADGGSTHGKTEEG